MYWTDSQIEIWSKSAVVVHIYEETWKRWQRLPFNGYSSISRSLSTVGIIQTSYQRCSSQLAMLAKLEESVCWIAGFTTRFIAGKFGHSFCLTKILALFLLPCTLNMTWYKRENQLHWRTGVWSSVGISFSLLDVSNWTSTENYNNWCLVARPTSLLHPTLLPLLPWCDSSKSVEEKRCCQESQ